MSMNSMEYYTPFFRERLRNGADPVKLVDKAIKKATLYVDRYYSEAQIAKWDAEPFDCYLACHRVSNLRAPGKLLYMLARDTASYKGKVYAELAIKLAEASVELMQKASSISSLLGLGHRCCDGTDTDDIITVSTVQQWTKYQREELQEEIEREELQESLEALEREEAAA